MYLTFFSLTLEWTLCPKSKQTEVSALRDHWHDCVPRSAQIGPFTFILCVDDFFRNKDSILKRSPSLLFSFQIKNLAPPQH